MISEAFRLSLPPLLLVAVCGTVRAQSGPCPAAPIQVDESIASLHRERRSMANENLQELLTETIKEHVTGVVVLRVDVDAAGRVLAVAPLSGPRELAEIYEDEEKRTAYSPFKQDGESRCARFLRRYEVTLNTTHDNDAKATDKFLPSFTKCAALSAKGSGPELLIPCGRAASAADLLSGPHAATNKQAAYTYYATALMQNNRAPEALPYAEKAVASADLGFDDILGKAAAYGVRGQARGLTGDPRGADEDLMKAEQLERAALEVPQSRERRVAAKRALKAMLDFHAGILSGLGERQAADKLHDEASRL